MIRRMEEKSRSGYLYALAATALWSFNFIVARGLSDQIDPISLAFYRWLTAALAITPLAVKGLIREFKAVRKNLPYLCIVSFLGVTVFNTLIYFAGRSTTAVNMSMIVITTPVYIALFSLVFLKERLGSVKIAGMAVVILGALILVSGGRPGRIFSMNPVFGDLLMLLAAMIFSAYSLLLRFKPKELSLFPFQYLTFLLGLLFLLPFFIAAQIKSPSPLPGGKVLLSILYVGIFASLTSFVLWNKAISQIGAVRAGIAYDSMPLFSAILAGLFLGEEFRSFHWISFLLIVVGILIANGMIGPKPGPTDS
jgi:drug/metabolite transporter (DMT)-like permease